MNVYRDLNDLPDFRNAVITTGSFDGVHRGHQKILRRINQLAKNCNGESVVITFDPHPRQVIYPKDDTLQLLTSTAEKLEYFEAYGIDNAVVLPFTIEFSQQHAREYVEKFIIGKFHPHSLVVGYDHRFGLNREGSFLLLKEYADRGEFELVQIGKEDISDITVSSTKIRQFLNAGDIEKANTLLSHPYRLKGKVIHGMKVGKELGFPTANIEIDSKVKLLPPLGIYAVHVIVDNVQLEGMLYIGKRPTLKPDVRTTSIEVHIFDFDRDIYDASISIDLVAYVRKDQELSGLEALKEAIQQDSVTIKRILANYSFPTQNTEVAVVALNYNGKDLFPKFLPSVIAHSPDVDVIIADNASTDGSVKYLREEYPDIDIIELKSNTGYAGGYNNALSQLNYKYFILINTDIEVTPNWIEPLLHILENDNSVAAVQPKILDYTNREKFEYAGACGGFIDNLGYPFCAGRILDNVENDEHQYDVERNIFWASGAAFAIRSEVFNQLGGFDADYFAHMEEIDLCWRIQRAGFHIRFTPKSVVYHLGGGTLAYNSSRKVLLNFRNNINTLIKNSQFSKLLWLLPVRFCLDVLASIHFLLSGKVALSFAIVKAYFQILTRLPKTLSKRKIKGVDKGNLNHKLGALDGVYKGSILWQNYIKGNKTFSSMDSKWYE